MWRGPLLIAAALIGIGILADRGFDAIRQMPSAPSYKRLTFRRGTVFTARFAPDGQTVVYSGAWEGQPTDLRDTGRQHRVAQPAIAGRQGPRRFSTGELAISIGRESVWESTGTLARVPLEGGAPREVLENVLLADWTPDGRDLAVVHEVGGKYRVEFPIGKVLYETHR